MAVVSFAADILPLFSKTTDIPHMARHGVKLDDYAYMSDPGNAQGVLDRLDGSGGAIMPPPPASPWPQAQIDTFKAWIAGGYQP